jgi:hypothetical protein
MAALASRAVFCYAFRTLPLFCAAEGEYITMIDDAALTAWFERKDCAVKAGDQLKRELLRHKQDRRNLIEDSLAMVRESRAHLRGMAEARAAFPADLDWAWEKVPPPSGPTI